MNLGEGHEHSGHRTPCLCWRWDRVFSSDKHEDCLSPRLRLEENVKYYRFISRCRAPTYRAGGGGVFTFQKLLEGFIHSFSPLGG